ncbi:MAG: SoxR reducing system RseC family protein [Candidatus Delongbacteria bacterium]
MESPQALRRPPELQLEEGVVLEVELGPPARIRVQLSAGPGCEECGARLICRPEDPERRSLWVRVDDPLPDVGSQVRLAVEGSRLLVASTWAYGLPLLGLCAGVGLGWWLGAGWPARELLAFLAGLLGAALPYALLARRSRRRPEEEWLGARLLP